MSAQPVPTLAQRRQLERYIQRRYPVRQYQDAQLSYEMERLHAQPTPERHAAPARDPIREDFVISVLGVATLVLLVIFFFLGVPA